MSDHNDSEGPTEMVELSRMSCDVTSALPALDSEEIIIHVFIYSFLFSDYGYFSCIFIAEFLEIRQHKEAV